MRLGTLAKKIGVKPSALADYLNKNHPAEEEYTLNSKLDESLIFHSSSYFTEDLNQVTSKNIVPEIKEGAVTRDSQVVKEDKSVENDETNSEYVPKFQRGDEISAEIIESAPYIEKPKIVLDGLKVVDKIDPEALAQRLDKKKIKDDEERQKLKEEKAQREKEKAEAKYERYVKAKKRAEEREKKEQRNKQEKLKKKLARERQRHYLEKIKQKKLQTKAQSDVFSTETSSESTEALEVRSIESKKSSNPLKRLWDWLTNA